MLLYPKESYAICGVIYEVYKKFRNNHKEIIYQNAIFNDLVNKEFLVEKEKRIDVFHDGKKIGTYVIDLVVNDIIIIELKVKQRLTQPDVKQFWHYLTSSKYKLGFLVNFGRPDGVEIIRKVYTRGR